MKILFTEKYVLLNNILQGNAAAKHDVFVFTEKKSHIKKEVKQVLVELGSFGLKCIANKLKLETDVPLYVKNFASHIEEVKPDAVVCFQFYHLVLWQALFRKNDYKYVMVLISETQYLPRNFLPRIFMRIFIVLFSSIINRVDYIFVQTIAGQDFFKKYFNKEVNLLLMPIDDSMNVQQRESGFLKNNKFTIVMNARYVQYKNHELLFEALSELRNKGVPAEVVCLSSHDYGKSDIVKMARKVKVSKHVKFIESVPKEELVNVYNDVDVLILPSKHEAIGMVVPEAMALGVPVAVSNKVGARVYLPDKYKYVFDPENVTEMVSILEKMYDPGVLERTAKENKERIRDFTAEKVNKKFYDSFCEINDK